MAAEILTPEQYADWLTPFQALESLGGLGVVTAVNAMLLRLRSGTLRSVAEKLSWRSGRMLNQIEFAIIDPDDWQNATGVDDPYSDFWTKLGDVLFIDRTDGDSYVITGERIRFDPVVIGSLAPPKKVITASPLPAPIVPLRPHAGSRMQGIYATPTPARKPERARAVGFSEVEAWYGSLGPSEKARGLRWLWAEAKASLGDVKRKQVEPFVRGRKRGPRV